MSSPSPDAITAPSSTASCRRTPSSKRALLGNVSTLGGVILTREHGPVWFALLNQGSNRSALRAHQDALLTSLTQSWGSLDAPPAPFKPFDFVMEFERDAILTRQSRY